jgi:hypothetical protein
MNTQTKRLHRQYRKGKRLAKISGTSVAPFKKWTRSLVVTNAAMSEVAQAWRRRKRLAP